MPVSVAYTRSTACLVSCSTSARLSWAHSKSLGSRHKRLSLERQPRTRVRLGGTAGDWKHSRCGFLPYIDAGNTSYAECIGPSCDGPVGKTDKLKGEPRLSAEAPLYHVEVE